MKAKYGGTLRTITSAKVKVAGTLRSLRSIKVMQGGVLRTVATFTAPMSVSAPDVANSIQTGDETTRPSTATVTGGLGPYTYLWVILSGSATINSPTFATTTFTKPGFTDGDTITAQVTVTDSLGATASDPMTALWRDAIDI